ncbi:MAG TPA: 50S ribosomal protein L30 [Thermoproteota archaeon]|nr:50S ribosomal protein L30 [Thermoproteota archaeon]
MSDQQTISPLLLVVRIRGTLNVRKDMKGALESLRLGRVHTATLHRNEPSVKGALQAIKDFVAWGEIDEETLTKLLQKRARLAGNKHVESEYLKKHLGVSDFSGLAKSLMSLKADFSALPGVKPYFRLHPPRKGYHVKLERSRRGKTSISGYLGKQINELVNRMI